NSGQPWQALGTARAGNETELHFRLAHLCLGGGDTIMAGHGGLQAAAERTAVNCGDDRLWTVLDAVQQRVQTRIAAAAVLDHVLKFADVRAGDEPTTRADEHDR